MTINIDAWLMQLDQMIDRTIVEEAPVLRDIARGVLADEDIARVALRHYAEVRTFIDIKLPARLRLCPTDDYKAKKYFSALYVEEQGEFEPGRNHAQLFATFCLALGLTKSQMEEEFQKYWPNYSYMLIAQPSDRQILLELATSYTWESMIRRIAGPLQDLVDEISSRFDIPPDAAVYFPGHIQLDEEHEQMARDALAHYATSESNRSLIWAEVRRTLLEANPWVLPAFSVE